MLRILIDMLKLWIFGILTMFMMYGAISMANAADSCEASRRTVVRVNKCPENKAEWIEAAQRKNCSAFAESCLEPDKFVYHCVLNPYVNETLEVCAYPRNILLGRCTGYTILGNLIQESGKDCRSFATPCPVTYHSTDAYKYQECYKQVPIPTVSSTKAITTHMSAEVSKEQPGNNSKFPFRINSSNEDVTMTTEKNSTDRLEKKDNNGIIIIITVVCCVVVVLLGLLLIIVFLRRRFRQHGSTSQDTRNSNLRESSRMLPNETENNGTANINPN